MVPEAQMRSVIYLVQHTTGDCFTDTRQLRYITTHCTERNNSLGVPVEIECFAWLLMGVKTRYPLSTLLLVQHSYVEKLSIIIIMVKPVQNILKKSKITVKIMIEVISYLVEYEEKG